MLVESHVLKCPDSKSFTALSSQFPFPAPVLICQNQFQYTHNAQTSITLNSISYSPCYNVLPRQPFVILLDMLLLLMLLDSFLLVGSFITGCCLLVRLWVVRILFQNPVLLIS